jgi:hypothetical protein
MNTIVLAVLLTVVQTSPPVPRKATDSTTSARQNVQKDTKTNKNQPIRRLPLSHRISPYPISPMEANKETAIQKIP